MAKEHQQPKQSIIDQMNEHLKALDIHIAESNDPRDVPFLERTAAKCRICGDHSNTMLHIPRMSIGRSRNLRHAHICADLATCIQRVRDKRAALDDRMKTLAEAVKLPKKK